MFSENRFLASCLLTKKVEEMEREEHCVLFMLDNADHFTAGKGKEGKNLKTTLMEFLACLAKFSESKGKRSPLKVLLTLELSLEVPNRWMILK